MNINFPFFFSASYSKFSSWRQKVSLVSGSFFLVYGCILGRVCRDLIIFLSLSFDSVLGMKCCLNEIHVFWFVYFFHPPSTTQDKSASLDVFFEQRLSIISFHRLLFKSSSSFFLFQSLSTSLSSWRREENFMAVIDLIPCLKHFHAFLYYFSCSFLGTPFSSFTDC